MWRELELLVVGVDRRPEGGDGVNRIISHC